jgi:hypothetical protein
VRYLLEYFVPPRLVYSFRSVINFFMFGGKMTVVQRNSIWLVAQAAVLLSTLGSAQAF